MNDLKDEAAEGSRINCLLKKRTVISDKKDIVFCFLFGIFSIMAVNFSIFYNFSLGFTISYVVIFLLSLFYLKSKELKFTPFSCFCAISALAISLTFSIYSNGFVLFFAFIALFVLTAITFLSVCDGAYFSNSSYLHIFDMLNLSVVVPLINLDKTAISLFSKNKKNKNLVSVFIGALCTIPVLFIIIPLLISSDAAFEGLIQKMFNFDILIASVIFGLLLFVPLFTCVFSLKHKIVKPERKLNFNFKGVNIFAINTFLSVICFVYLIYFLSQSAYFLNGFANILPQGYSFAEYARRGFFEMSLICLINLIVVFITSVLSKKDKGKIPVSGRILSLIICIFSLLFISTVAAKMYMYINRYGMTRLRIITSVFMFMLLTVFILVIIRLFVVKFPYMRLAVIFVTLIALTVAFSDIDTIVSKYNVYAYKNGLIQEIDVKALQYLSDSSVPYLIDLLDDNDNNVALQAKEALKYKMSAHFEIGVNNELIQLNSDDFRAFNYNRQRAKKLLKLNKDRIL